jgi:hypothetical protein
MTVDLPTLDLSPYRTRALENFQKLEEGTLSYEQWKDVSLLMLSHILGFEEEAPDTYKAP